MGTLINYALVWAGMSWATLGIFQMELEIRYKVLSKCTVFPMLNPLDDGLYICMDLPQVPHKVVLDHVMTHVHKHQEDQKWFD